MKKETLEYLRDNDHYGISDIPYKVIRDYEKALERVAKKKLDSKAEDIRIFSEHAKSIRLWAYRLYSLNSPNDIIEVEKDAENIRSMPIYVEVYSGIELSPETVYRGVVENKVGYSDGIAIQVVNSRVWYLDERHAVAKFGVMFSKDEDYGTNKVIFTMEYEAHCVRIEEDKLDLS